jgi:hypothetical protein
VLGEIGGGKVKKVDKLALNFIVDYDCMANYICALTDEGEVYHIDNHLNTY